MVHSHVVFFYIVISFLGYVSFRHTDDHDITCMIHVVHLHILRTDSLLHMHTNTQGCCPCSNTIPTCINLWSFFSGILVPPVCGLFWPLICPFMF